MRNTVSIHSPNQSMKYTFIIPAAGGGIRMLSKEPKILTEIKNTTILENQIRIIDKHYVNYEIIIVGGFGFEYLKDKLDEIRNNKITLIENKLYDQFNICHSINLGLQNRKYNNVMILYGDLVFNSYALKLPTNKTSFAVLSDNMNKGDKGCIIQGGEIKNIAYNINNKWGEIAYITGRELEQLDEFMQTPNYKLSFGFEALNYIIDQGGIIRPMRPKRSKIMDIDSPKDLKRVEEII
jgi:choline kinase